MELKATLKKPYNYKERADFVSKWINYEIEETEDLIQVWVKTEEEQKELEKENQKISVRSIRNKYLADSDKFVSVPDFPITEEEKEKYKEYRQYLRDYPESSEDWYKQKPKTFEEWSKG